MFQHLTANLKQTSDNVMDIQIKSLGWFYNQWPEIRLQQVIT